MNGLRNRLIFVCTIFLTFNAFSAYSKDTIHLTQLKKMDLIQKVTISGKIQPARKTIILPPFNGYVHKLFVKVGDQVKKEAPLVSFIPTLGGGDPSFPIRSPFAGLVVQVNKVEGEFVKESNPDDFVVRIDDLSKVYVQAKAPEMDSVKLKIGQEVIVKIAALGNKTYDGLVTDIDLAAAQGNSFRDGDRSQFGVKIEILKFDKEVKAGMSALLDITTNKFEKALTLPHQYIFRDKDVFFVKREKGERVDIKVGAQNDEVVQVIEGLKEGESVQQVNPESFIDESQ